MKVLIILLLLMTLSYCLSMDNSFYWTTPESHQTNQNQSPIVSQHLSPIQQLALNAIEPSLHLVNTILSHLPATIEIPMSAYYKSRYALFETSVQILTSFLEIAYFHKVILKVDAMSYKKGKEVHFMYPISIALDFLNIPLLIACKKHFNNSASFPSALCFEDKKPISALEKYKHKQEKLFNLCTEWAKKDKDGQIISYFMDECAKLPRIFKVLTIPDCYEA